MRYAYTLNIFSVPSFNFKIPDMDKIYRVAQKWEREGKDKHMKAKYTSRPRAHIQHFI